jgi:hypothetical protein
MSEKHLINFKVDDSDEIKNAQNNVEFALTSGCPEIKVNDINITDDLDSGGVIDFAIDFLSQVPKILEGKEEVNIPYNDDIWNFTFKRWTLDSGNFDFVKCDVNEWYSEKNTDYPTREFCLDVLYAAKNLEKHMQKNEFVNRFSFYNLFDQVKHSAINSMVQNGLISKML